MKNKGILKQMQENPITKNNGSINLEDIKKAIYYIFKDYKLKKQQIRL